MKRIASWMLTLALLCVGVPAWAAPDFVGEYFNGRAAFMENGKFGFLDEENQVVVPAVYDDMRVYSGGYARVARWFGETQLWGVVNLEGEEVLPLRYGWIGELSEGLRAACLEGKWGYLDESFQVAIPHQFTSEAEEFEGGYAQVGMADETGRPLRGLIDRQGRQVVPCRYITVIPDKLPGSDLALVLSWEELYGAVSLSTGEEVYPCRFRSAEALTSAVREGRFDPDFLWKEAAAKSEAAGLQVTWYPQYESLTRFYGTDRMLVRKNGLYALADLEGEPVTDFAFDAVDALDEKGQAVAMKNGKWGKVDRDGNVITPFVYSAIQETGEPVNAQIVNQGGTFAVADLAGNLLTGYVYWNAHPFSHGYALVQNQAGLWGYVDQTGREAVPCRYSGWGMEDFGPDGFAIVNQSSGYNAVDATGREVFPFFAGKLWRAGQGMWGYTRGENDLVGFADRNGAVVIQPQYEYLTGPKGEMRGNLFDENTGLAQVWESRDGEPHYIDVTGARVPAPEPVDENAVPHEGLVWENQDGGAFGWGGGRWGFRDEGGRLVVPYLYDAVGHFDQGYASVQVDGVYGILKNPVLNSPWAAREVAQADGAGYVTSRCALYQTDPITRLQFAELAVNYLEKTTGTPVAPAKEDAFTDTADEAVLKAVAAGIAQGKGNALFDPDGLLTRQELAAMLFRAMERAGAALPKAPLDFTAYTDGVQVAPWAREAVSALVQGGVMAGTGENTLSPKDNCTVEQAILLVYRATK